MNKKRIGLVMVFVLLNAGCALIAPREEFSSGNLNNLYRGDEDLDRMEIIKFPNSPEDSQGYSEGSHPAGIIYFFKNGSHRIVEYDPHGKVIGSLWGE